MLWANLENISGEINETSFFAGYGFCSDQFWFAVNQTDFVTFRSLERQGACLTEFPIGITLGGGDEVVVGSYPTLFQRWVLKICPLMFIPRYISASNSLLILYIIFKNRIKIFFVRIWIKECYQQVSRAYFGLIMIGFVRNLWFRKTLFVTYLVRVTNSLELNSFSREIPLLCIQRSWGIRLYEGDVGE